MKVTFISNYLNHHQIPFCLAMDKLCDGEFRFVSMGKMSEERKRLGYSFDNEYDFEVKYNIHPDLVENLIEESDVVIYGGGSYTNKVSNRILQNKLTFLYSERFYKKSLLYFFSPRGLYYRYKTDTVYRKNNYYLLSASAYAPFDFALSNAFINKSYKWGYFPETKRYNIEELIKNKEENSILWVARFIDWKHPDKAIKVAKKLKEDGIQFKLRFIGIGELEDSMKQLSKSYGLEENIEFLGAMKPQEVREHMEKSQIFLFTSDRGEGWGAVLNESMNSGCAAVADKHIGAAPYLIKDGENGLLYNGSVNELYKKTKYLLQNQEEAKELGTKAYQTITEEWNAEVAAERILQLAEKLNNNENCVFEDGPCSKAKVMWG